MNFGCFGYLIWCLVQNLKNYFVFLSGCFFSIQIYFAQLLFFKFYQLYSHHYGSSQIQLISFSFKILKKIIYYWFPHFHHHPRLVPLRSSNHFLKYVNLAFFVSKFMSVSCFQKCNSPNASTFLKIILSYFASIKKYCASLAALMLISIVINHFISFQYRLWKILWCLMTSRYFFYFQSLRWIGYLYWVLIKVMIVHLICLTLSMCCLYNFALVNY